MTKSVPSLERRQRERVQQRQQTRDAARRMFVQRGYEATPMRPIAARIGYTPTAIYHHFEDKEALVAELSALDFRAFAQALQDFGAVADPVERLRRTGRAYVAFGVANPMHYQFLFMTRRPKESPKGTGQPDPGEDAYGFLRQTCADAIAAGRLRPEFTDADEVPQIACGAMHGLVALHIAKLDDPWIHWRDVRQTAARACDALLRGLVREPET